MVTSSVRSRVSVLGPLAAYVSASAGVRRGSSFLADGILERERLRDERAAFAHVGIASGDLLADVVVPGQPVLPVVDPTQLLAEPVDDAVGAVRQQASHITAALASVLERSVVLVARLVAVVRD